MAFPNDQQDVEVGLFINGAWVDAVDVGNGVRERDAITIRRGRANWSSRVETSSAGWTMDNRDGRWSPDYASGAYAGLYKRNIPCRVGAGRGFKYLGLTGQGADVASTPDVLGTGGGSPTAPNVVDITSDSETAYTTTHTYSLPATVAAGNRLLLVANIAHNTAAPSGGTMDDWTLAYTDSLHTFNRFSVYEIEVEDATQATALAGSTVTFSTTNGCRSSCQVIRVNGARAGGLGTAWDVSAGARTAAGTPDTNPNPDSLTVTWGADENLFLALFGAGGDGATVTTNPSGYTAGADGNAAADYIVGSAYKTSSAATDDPGTFTLDLSEQWAAVTFAYRALEDTSSDGVLDITGDIDIRIEFDMLEDLVDITEGGARARLARKSAGSDGWEWQMYIANGIPVLSFYWWDSSGVYSFPTTEATGADPPWSILSERTALRVTLDVNNGASGHDVAFYYSDAIGGTWTQIGSTITTAGTTSIGSNDADLRVGGDPQERFTPRIELPAKIRKFELRDGIAGTAVANPDFTAQTVGATSFADSAGRTWTIGAGGELTDMEWRFHGELASLPVRWNVDGSDVTAPVEAAGLFRRLRQGARPVTSPFRRAIIADAADLVQYWPLEETGTQIRRFGAAVGNSPHTVEGGYPTTSTSDTFLSIASIVDPNSTTFICNVDEYTATGEIQIRWLMSVPAALSLTDSVLLRVYTSDLRWEVLWEDGTPTPVGGMKVQALRGNTVEYSTGYTNFEAIGKSLRMTFNLRQDGANIDYTLKGQQVNETVAGGVAVSAAVAGSVGTATRLVWFPAKDWSGMDVGQITLQSSITADDELNEPLNAYDGEKAGRRIERLCREDGIATRIRGNPDDTEAMGPQRASSLMDLLEECADTDLGFLYESRDSVAVGYRTRTDMVDQAVQVALDYSTGEVAASPELDRDDQDFANDVTVRNATGSTARAVIDDGSDLSVSPPPVGAGRYDTTFEVNGQDSRLADLANTRLALTSVDEPRISSLVLALHHSAVAGDAALTADILTMDLGDLITVSNNLTVALGTTVIRQLVQGYQERIEPYRHFVDLLTSPSSPWETGQVVDPPEPHQVTFRSQQTLAVPGSPAHVLTALGYTGTTDITRAQLDGILDDWVDSTGGTTRTVTSAATWTTAMAAAVPGDLIRVTAQFDPGGNIQARGDKYGISGSNMTASPSGGQPGLPIILTCADGVYVDDNNTSSGTAILDISNVSHVWAVGFNVRDGQFGIRCQNWDGSDGFPVYMAYCTVDNTGDAGVAVQGWFQLITSSGGTPPAGTGNEHGYSQWVVIESNTVDGVGTVNAQFGEGIYLGKGSPGYVGYAKNVWVRGNDLTDWTSDGIDVKPGCSRVYVTDNNIYIGHAVSGSPLSLLYIGDAAGPDRPAWYDFDPEVYAEGNRVSDNDITNTDVSSAEWMVTVGLSGVRCARNIIWAWPSGSAAFRARMAIGANDTEAQNFYRTDPTWIINNTCWGADSFDPAGYGSPLTAWPSAVLNNFDVRNNIVDNATPATGEFDAASTDFIATVPAVAAAGAAQWLTYGRGSAFDLDPDSALTATGSSISDLEPFITDDISQRDVNTTTPNPGAFSQHPSNL